MTAWPLGYIATPLASAVSTVTADNCQHFFAAQSPLHLFVANLKDAHLFGAQSEAHFFKVASCTTH